MEEGKSGKNVKYPNFLNLQERKLICMPKIESCHLKKKKKELHSLTVFMTFFHKMEGFLRKSFDTKKHLYKIQKLFQSSIQYFYVKFKESKNIFSSKKITSLTLLFSSPWITTREEETGQTAAFKTGKTGEQRDLQLT